MKEFLRISRELEIREIEPNLNSVDPQDKAAPREEFSVQTEGQTTSMQLLAAKSKITLQMLSRV